MANNFKVFAENSSNLCTDTEWTSDSIRTEGSQSGGVIASKENNTALREATLLCTALINAFETLDKRVSPSVVYSLNDALEDFNTKLVNVLKSFTSDYTDSSCITTLNNAKSYSDTQISNAPTVRYVSQSLSDTQKTQARANIGAGTSSFSGNYNDLSNKPSLASVATSGNYNDLSNLPHVYMNSIAVYVETNSDNRYEAVLHILSTKTSFTKSELVAYLPLNQQISNDGVVWYQWDSESGTWSKYRDDTGTDVSMLNLSGTTVISLNGASSTNWGISSQGYIQVF